MDKRGIADFFVQLSTRVTDLHRLLPGEAQVVAGLARMVLEQLNALRTLAADDNRVLHYGTRRKLQSISDDAETLYVLCTLLAKDQIPVEYDSEKLMVLADGAAGTVLRLAEQSAAYYDKVARAPVVDKQAAAPSSSDQEKLGSGVSQVLSFEVTVPTDLGLVTRTVINKKIGPTRVSVYFGTTRAEEPNATLEHRFRDGRSDQDHLSFGVANVSLPPGHQLGELEEPLGMWGLRLTTNANKHVMVRELRVVQPSDWVTAAREESERSDRSCAFVFIHGFNVTFSQAIKRAAQIAHDIKYEGLVTAFSWESEGAAFGYGVDGEAVELAVTHLRDFLAKLHDEVGISELHIVAHSMGTRALLGALQSPPFWKSTSTPIVEAVFAAPDIDATVYKRAVGKLLPLARRFTLYASKRDITMALSGLLRNTYPRAGDAGDGIVVIAGMDTIDATPVGDHLFGLGHSYVANKPSILRDLWALIRGAPVPRHRMIKRQHASGNHFWELQP